MRSARSTRFSAVMLIVIWVGMVTAMFADANSRLSYYIAVLSVAVGLWRCIVWICAAKVGRAPKGIEWFVPLCLFKRSRLIPPVS